MINYNTPITDAILQKNGWIRFENTPVYVKKLENQYMTSFMLDFFNYQQKYEEYFGTIWKDKTDEEKYQYLYWPNITANSISVEAPRIDLLYREAADAYHHNAMSIGSPDFTLHNQYVEKYQIISGLDYRTGKPLS